MSPKNKQLDSCKQSKFRRNNGNSKTNPESCHSPRLSKKMLENSVLLLNFDQSPLNVITMRRALDLMTKNKVYYEETSDHIKIKCIDREVKIPKVMILKYYVKVPLKKTYPSKKNILRRDKYICQYCNVELVEHNATVDHIVPRHRGGSNSWVNMVAACRDCNLFKGNRTPKEAGMELLNKPKEPSYNLIFDDILRFFLRKK